MIIKLFSIQKFANKNVLVLLVYSRMWHVASGSETSENVRYQGLETIRRQAKSDCTPTKLQLQPDYEEIGQRGK